MCHNYGPEITDEHLNTIFGDNWHWCMAAIGFSVLKDPSPTGQYLVRMDVSARTDIVWPLPLIWLPDLYRFFDLLWARDDQPPGADTLRTFAFTVEDKSNADTTDRS